MLASPAQACGLYGLEHHIREESPVWVRLMERISERDSDKLKQKKPEVQMAEKARPDFSASIKRISEKARKDSRIKVAENSAGKKSKAKP